VGILETAARVDSAERRNSEIIVRLDNLEAGPVTIVQLQDRAALAESRNEEFSGRLLALESSGGGVLTGADIMAAKIGHWTIAANQDPTLAWNRFTNAVGTIACTPSGGLIATGHIYGDGFAEINPPATLGSGASFPNGTFVGPWRTLPPSIQVHPNEDELAGLLVMLSGMIRGTLRDTYNTSGSGNPPGQWAWNAGTWTPIYAIAGPQVNHNRTAGYLCHAPASMSGVDYLCGLAGAAGAGSGSEGPALFAVTGTTATPLLCYPMADGITSPGWTRACEVRGCAWIGDSVLFFGRRARGMVWYGTGFDGRYANGELVLDADGNHVVSEGGGNSKGYHGQWYDSVCWIYRASDLLAVHAGTSTHNSPQPTEIVDLAPIVRGNGGVAVFAGGMGNRVVICEPRAILVGYEHKPLYHELRF
jgi:hypothetical protein